VNFAYIADVGLLVYNQCVIWELNMPIFFGYTNLSLRQAIGPQWASSLKVKMTSLAVNSGSMHISITLCNINTPTLINSLVKPQNHLSRQKNMRDFFKMNLSQFKATVDKEIFHTQ
jgi:hypothetical protein